MHYVLITALLFVLPMSSYPQDDERGRNAAEVRAAVRDVASRNGKATVLTRKLVVYSGRVVMVQDDSFTLNVKKALSKIYYEDVLELSTGEKQLSFVPDLEKQGHGRWEDVSLVYPGTKIVIRLKDDKVIKGFSNSATSTHIVFAHREKFERTEIRRDQIAAIYALIGGYGGVKTYASKARDASRGDRDKLLGGAITGVAALLGFIKSDGHPILIYSK